jgi:hypothetical protein
MHITQEDYDTLRELEESLWRTETRFNQEYMDRILAPDFFEFGHSGRIYQRADTLAAPFVKIKAKLPLDDFSVRLLDTNVALVTYTSKVTHEQVEVANRSSIWCKTAAGWQIKFHQGTPVTT